MTHLGFYADGSIQRHVPKILYRADPVAFTREEAAKRRAAEGNEAAVADAIEKLLQSGARTEANEYCVFILSRPDDPRLTVILDEPIVNDTKTAAGRPWAWTLGQRYTSLVRLKRPGTTKTSHLDVP